MLKKFTAIFLLIALTAFGAPLSLIAEASDIFDSFTNISSPKWYQTSGTALTAVTNQTLIQKMGNGILRTGSGTSTILYKLGGNLGYFEILACLDGNGTTTPVAASNLSFSISPDNVNWTDYITYTTSDVDIWSDHSAWARTYKFAGIVSGIRYLKITIPNYSPTWYPSVHMVKLIESTTTDITGETDNSYKQWYATNGTSLTDVTDTGIINQLGKGVCRSGSGTSDIIYKSELGMDSFSITGYLPGTSPGPTSSCNLLFSVSSDTLNWSTYTDLSISDYNLWGDGSGWRRTYTSNNMEPGMKYLKITIPDYSSYSFPSVHGVNIYQASDIVDEMNVSSPKWYSSNGAGLMNVNNTGLIAVLGDGILRSSAGSASNIIYKSNVDMDSFSVMGYIEGDGTAPIAACNFTFSISHDNVNWTPYTAVTTSDVNLWGDGTGWKRTYASGILPRGIHYVRITVPDYTPFYYPTLHQVKVIRAKSAIAEFDMDAPTLFDVLGTKPVSVNNAALTDRIGKGIRKDGTGSTELIYKIDTNIGYFKVKGLLQGNGTAPISACNLQFSLSGDNQTYTPYTACTATDYDLWGDKTLWTRTYTSTLIPSNMKYLKITIPDFSTFYYPSVHQVYIQRIDNAVNNPDTVFVDDTMSVSNPKWYSASGASLATNTAGLADVIGKNVYRTSAGTASIVYRLTGGFNAFEIMGFLAGNGTQTPVAGTNLTFQVSSDTVNWTTISDSSIMKSDYDIWGDRSSWVRIYTYTGLTSATQYLKIIIPDFSTLYLPSLHRVTLIKYAEGSSLITDGLKYYVDSANGNDTNDGLSPDRAFASLTKSSRLVLKPGDRILFKADTTYNGNYVLHGCGNTSNSIRVDMYGYGNKPKIIGATGGGSAVIIKTDGVAVSNLDISNPSSGYQGILISPSKSGTYYNIAIQNLYVHDVPGNAERDSGGIIAKVSNTFAASKFDGLVIENCKVYNVGRSGILVNSIWCKRYGLSWTNYGYVAELNVSVRKNVVDTIGGDGILVMNCNTPYIEYNKAYRCQWWDTTSPNAAIWPFNCDNAVIQYNEAAYTKLLTGDGEGFDIDDMCFNTILQYNYSHDNEGGFLLLCSTSYNGNSLNTGAVVRFNLSINDGYKASEPTRTAFGICFAGPVTNAKIYNNTIYAGVGSPEVVSVNNWSGDGYASNCELRNNIFDNQSGAKFFVNNAVNFLFDNNVYCGNTFTGRPTDANVKTADPLFINAGITGNGLGIAEGYRLCMNSPYISAGAAIDSNGSKDLLGRDISDIKFIGACYK